VFLGVEITLHSTPQNTINNVDVDDVFSRIVLRKDD